MAEPQHDVFHGYPVLVEQVGEDEWNVQVRNLDGNLVADVTVSEKPIREQLETFFGRMFPRALPASREMMEWGERYAKEHPEEYEKIRGALRRGKVKEPIRTGFVSRPVEAGTGPRLTPEQSAKWERAADRMRRQPNPAPTSAADLTRRLKF